MRNPVVEVENDDFLSQVAAVEAQALSTKRRKITTAAAASTWTRNLSEAKTHKEEMAAAEGAYTAALRGTRSVLFQQQSSRANVRHNVVVADNPNVFPDLGFGGGGGSGGGNTVGGSCFKCGKSGHWARDCDANSNAVDHSLPEKACPCGLGACIVLTANTEKNRGRKFYKCPLREESGGCGFFEWCDKNSGTVDMTSNSQSYVLNPSIPDLTCPCGAGSCLILTAKKGKHIGQQFYRCPSAQGNTGGFFKWCHDHKITDSLSVSVNPPVACKNDVNSRSFSINGSSCFKCGKDGHWAKDCLLPSTQNPADVGRSSASAGTCYKCGVPGHWAKNCTS